MITFEPNAGIGAIFGVFLFGCLGLLLVFRPEAMNRFYRGFGPPGAPPMFHGPMIGIRLCGAAFALLGSYFFFGLMAARQ